MAISQKLLISDSFYLDKLTSQAIGSGLGRGLSVQDFAKELYERGFTNLYLATGYLV